MSTSRRRSRFTVTVENFSGEHIPFVILAYDAAGAQTYYARAGYKVVKVEAGDFRRKAGPKVRTQQGATKTLKINRANLAKAIEFLELDRPVDLHFNSRYGSTYGNHRCRPVGLFGWKHRIMVKSYLTPEQAGETLWHELGHGLQFERDIIALGLNHRESLTRWNKAYRDGTSYRNKPYEIEARSFEQHNVEIPLFESERANSVKAAA